MKGLIWTGVGFLAAVVLVVAGLAVGWAVWGRQLWAGWEYGMGPGMGGGWRTAPPCAAPGEECPHGSQTAWEDASLATGTLTIEQAHEAVEQYVDGLDYSGLEIAELMEFEHNFYAIVREADSGVGAMELLVDKRTGAVGPEMGPNMMWNAGYGMHGSGTRETNSVTPVEALEAAQRWLDAHQPGMSVEEHADPFYGYYTIHTQRDGQIEGMLSVHGATSQVWYHSWHGTFVQMIEEEH